MTAVYPKHTLSAILALVVMSVLLLTGCSRPAAEGDQPQADLAKDFPIDIYQSGELLGGSPIRFKQILEEEKPVVLNFWAALCPPCRAEMPDIQRVSEQFQGRVNFFGLDVGPFQFLGTRDQGRHLLKILDISYPSGSTESGQVIEDYGISSMPTTFFIKANGEIQRKWAGLLNEEKLVDLVEELLEG